MAHVDPIPGAVPVAGIAEPHQLTVAAIMRAAGNGLFTVAEAELLIDRVRAYAFGSRGGEQIRSPHSQSS